MRKTLHSPEYDRFIQVLARARRSAGLTQQALAAKLERPQSFVAKYENGERRIDMVEFVTIARAMNSDPVKLLRDFIAAASGEAVAPRRRKGPGSRAIKA